MVSVPLSKTSLRWIRHPVRSSCSEEEDGTGSKLCSVNRMALSWSINGYLSGVDINGPGSSQKSGIFPGGSLTGWCQELISTNQKHSKQSKKHLNSGKNPAQKNGRFPYKFSVFQPLFSFKNSCVSGIINVSNPRRERCFQCKRHPAARAEGYHNTTENNDLWADRTDQISPSCYWRKKQPRKSPSGTGRLSYQKAFRFFQRKKNRWHSGTVAPFWCYVKKKYKLNITNFLLLVYSFN